MSVPGHETTSITQDFLMNMTGNRYFEYVTDSKTGSVIYMIDEGVEPSGSEFKMIDEDKDILRRAVFVHGSRRFKHRVGYLLSAASSAQ